MKFQIHSNTFRKTRQIAEQMAEQLKADGINFQISKRNDRWEIIIDNFHFYFVPEILEGLQSFNFKGKMSPELKE